MKIAVGYWQEAMIFDSFKGFHQFHEDETQQPYGSFKIFFNEGNLEPEYETADKPKNGWYWWSCFEGCLPDGQPSGPFYTSRQALEDADEWNPEFDD